MAFGEAGEYLASYRKGERRTSVEVVVLRSDPAPLPRKAQPEPEPPAEGGAAEEPAGAPEPAAEPGIALSADELAALLAAGADDEVRDLLAAGRFAEAIDVARLNQAEAAFNWDEPRNRPRH